MAAPAFDTVIVPDFRDASRTGRFEPQTLFFLASWIEHSAGARHWPVHVACIGEPPASVRHLAEQCGARVTVHESREDELGRFGNKLCAWDVDVQTDQLLYLDADMLCLSSPVGLGECARCAGGSPAGLPRVPEQYWIEIDRRLNLPAPTERMPCTFASVGIPLAGRRYGSENSFGRAMWPLYNGGLIYVPFGAPLPGLWVEHWNAIGAMFGEDDPMWVDVVLSDMTALATALRELNGRGEFELITLPETYNTRWMQIVGGQATLHTSCLFHAVDLFREPIAGPDDLEAGVHRYLGQLQLWNREWARHVAVRRMKPGQALSMLRRGNEARHQMQRLLHELLSKHVQPAICAGQRVVA